MSGGSGCNIPCCLHFAVMLVHTLPEGRPVMALTTLGDELFVQTQYNDISIYDTSSYELRRSLAVPGLRDAVDMASCAWHRCVYVADVHRISADHLDAAIATWEVQDRPNSLSVSLDHNVLVTCSTSLRLKEFKTDGAIVREVSHVAVGNRLLVPFPTQVSKKYVPAVTGRGRRDSFF